MRSEKGGVAVFIENDPDNFGPYGAHITIKPIKGNIEYTATSMAHILAGGIGLLIKSCNTADTGITDHALLAEVIDHLEREFTSITAFDNASYNDNRGTK